MTSRSIGILIARGFRRILAVGLMIAARAIKVRAQMKISHALVNIIVALEVKPLLFEIAVWFNLALPPV